MAAEIEPSTPDLSEETREQIAAVLGVKVSAVEAAVAEALHDDLTAINAIKKAVYLAAITGDEDAQKLSVQIFSMVNELNRLKLLEVPPVNESGKATPYTAIRDSATVLALGAPVAVATLLQVARHGRTDAARMAAANSILDRTGLGRAERTELALIGPEQTNADGNGPTALDLIKARLMKLKPVDVIDAVMD